MHQEQLIEHIERQYQNNVEIVRAKNHDYAAPGDPFGNFRLCEVLGLCSVEVAIMVRLSDKISRIANLINFSPAVKDESIHDTISDAQNYLGILDAWLTQQKDAQVSLGLFEYDSTWGGMVPCNSHYAAERGEGEGI